MFYGNIAKYSYLKNVKITLLKCQLVQNFYQKKKSHVSKVYSIPSTLIFVYGHKNHIIVLDIHWLSEI